MRVAKTDVPALVLSEHSSGARVAFLVADLDRRYALANHPDHAHLLANLVRWAARDRIPLRVSGPGLLDGHLYRQPGRMILHLVNLTSAGTWRVPVEELVPVGPLKVSVRLEGGMRGAAAQLLVSGGKIPASVKDGRCNFQLRAIRDHEVVVIH